MVTLRDMLFGAAVLAGCSLAAPTVPATFTCPDGLCPAGYSCASDHTCQPNAAASSGSSSGGTGTVVTSGGASSGGSTGSMGIGSSGSSGGGTTSGGSSGSTGGSTGGGSSGGACGFYCSPTCSGNCQALAGMPTPRYDFATVVTPNGVFAIGGFLDTQGLIQSNAVEVYDPATNHWDQTYPQLPTPAAGVGGALGPGNALYVVGSGSAANGVWTYPLASGDGGSWAAGPPLNVGHQGAAVVANGSGLIYVISGYDPTQGAGVYTVEGIDPDAGGWSITSPSLTQAWKSASGAVDPNGTIYVVGDVDNAVRDLPSSGASTWAAVDYLPGRTSLGGAASAIDAEGNFWVLGGFEANQVDVVPDVFVATITSAQGSASTVNSLPTPRAGLGAFFGVGPNGQPYLYAIGGITDGGKVVGTVEAYSPDAGIW